MEYDDTTPYSFSDLTEDRARSEHQRDEFTQPCTPDTLSGYLMETQSIHFPHVGKDHNRKGQWKITADIMNSSEIQSHIYKKLSGGQTVGTSPPVGLWVAEVEESGYGVARWTVGKISRVYWSAKSVRLTVFFPGRIHDGHGHTNIVVDTIGKNHIADNSGRFIAKSNRISSDPKSDNARLVFFDEYLLSTKKKQSPTKTKGVNTPNDTPGEIKSAEIRDATPSSESGNMGSTDIGSNIRIKDLTEREEKLHRAQKQLTEDFERLTSERAVNHNSNEETVLYLEKELNTSLGQTAEYQARIDALHIKLEDSRNNAKVVVDGKVAELTKKLAISKQLLVEQRENEAKEKNLYQKQTSSNTAEMDKNVRTLKEQLKTSERELKKLEDEDASTLEQYRAHLDKTESAHEAEIQDLNDKLEHSKGTMEQLRAHTKNSMENAQKGHLQKTDIEKKKLDKVTKDLALSRQELEYFSKEHDKLKLQYSGELDESVKDNEARTERMMEEIVEAHKKTDVFKAQAIQFEKSAQSEKTRNTSIIEKHRVIIDKAKLESDRLMGIVKEYERKHSSDIHGTGTMDSIRSMIRSSLPSDMELQNSTTCDQLVDKVLQSIGSG